MSKEGASHISIIYMLREGEHYILVHVHVEGRSTHIVHTCILYASENSDQWDPLTSIVWTNRQNLRSGEGRKHLLLSYGNTRSYERMTVVGR